MAVNQTYRTYAQVEGQISAALGLGQYTTSEEVLSAITAASGFGNGGSIDSLGQVPPADSTTRTYFVNVIGNLTNFRTPGDAVLPVTTVGGIGVVVGSDTEGFNFIQYPVDSTGVNTVSKSPELQVLSSVSDTYNVGQELVMKVQDALTTLVLTDESGAAIAFNRTFKSFSKLKKVSASGWVLDKDVAILDGSSIVVLDKTIGSDQGVNMRSGSFRVTPNVLKDKNEFSVQMKFVNKPVSQNNYILGYSGALSSDGFSAFMNADNVRFMVGNGSQASHNTFYVNLVSGREYDIVYTISASMSRLFIDGLLVSEKPRVATTIGSLAPLNIGGLGNAAEPTNRGNQDVKLVRMFNRALSDAEILDIYHSEYDHIEDPTMILELNSKLASQKIWIDSSETSASVKLALENQKPILVQSSGEDSSPEFTELEKPNLFLKENIEHNKILDAGTGGVFPYNVDGTGADISGVVWFNSVPGKWYFVKGCFKGNYVQNSGQNDVGTHLGVLPTNLLRYYVVKAERRPELTPVPVTKIFLNLYRIQTESDLPTFEDVAIYELSDEFDVNIPEYISQGGEAYGLPSNVFEKGLLNPLRDKVFVSFGDSITAGHQWFLKLVDVKRLERAFNAAIGGANISILELDTPTGSPTDPYERRHLRPQIRYTPSRMSKRIFEWGEDIGGEKILKVDFVSISMGFNDANNARVIGDFAAIKAMDWTLLEDNTTVLGSLKYCLFWLQNTVIKETVSVTEGEVTTEYVVGLDYRDANFIFQTPIQTSVTTGTETRLPGVVQAVRDFCDYYAIPYVDAYTKAGISREVELLAPKYLKDQIHPNKEGYRKLGILNANEIGNRIL